ncbi:serine/threonine-protein kinase RsbW [Marmoricola sp. OAE513]|uniref:ATP-binding protein n=1 Tax=Marmoricola sp. OAE513 TaxID=2817894 RepID=UPI001AE7B809
MSCSLAAPLQGPVSLSLPFTSQSAGEVRRALVSWLRHHGSPESVIDDARLVATELVANAIRHADPLRNATLLVRWRQEGGDLVLTVADGGGATAPTLRVVTNESESGRGLAIVEALAVRWHVERSNQVHAVHVHLRMDGSGQPSLDDAL